MTPLSKVDKMVMINGDGEMGASKITEEVSRVMSQVRACTAAVHMAVRSHRVHVPSQVPDVVQSLTGVNLKTMLEDIGQ